jgi:ribosomal protein S18 acetylase RimI-like enzyme
MIDVRPATAADAAALARLRWEFRAGREAPAETEDAFLDRCARWMRRELEAGAPWRAWVAVPGKPDPSGPGDRIVGQIWLQVMQKLPNPVGERDRHGYLSNLYVQPGSRGGAGAHLVRTVLEWATANGLDRVVLWPSPLSVTLYERNGFTRAGDVMEWTSPRG